MTELVFPIWIVIWRRNFIDLPAEADGMPGYIAVFTSAAKAAAFISRRTKPGWESVQLTRPALASLRDRLRVTVGIRGLCLDPFGSHPGTAISFEELDRLGITGAGGES